MKLVRSTHTHTVSQSDQQQQQLSESQQEMTNPGEMVSQPASLRGTGGRVELVGENAANTHIL